ncbi:general substrate transporter [Talaromyces proteolyticus]|uniref:General substrate transporter n=1 Tax=Talaromyces proteolyticus TaxID=1131652 RepID=A0AAD4KD36_9EURO|nr:general substrate transporter [Talaromyces proteolyticus]KAH8688809.1 general substrate transporter [Talaromyces proteolyticus]
MSLKWTPTWLGNPGLCKLNFLLSLVLLSSAYQGFDNTMMSGLQSIPSWQEDMKNPRGAILGLLNSVQNVGAIIALPSVPILVDRLGRRHSLAFGAGVLLVAGVLQGTAFSVAQFIVARFLIGFGLAFTIVASPLLLVELALPQHRGVIMGLFPTVYYVGSISAAWIIYGTNSMSNSWAWRIPSLLQAAPALVQIWAIYFVPESPRWLISKGRDDKARQILARYHANNVLDDPIVALEYEEMKVAIVQDDHYKQQGSWKDLYQTAANRRRMIVVCFCALFIEVSGTGLVSTYIHTILDSVGITDSRTQTIFNGCISIYKFVISTVASLYVEKAGRRPLFIISTAGMLFSFIIWTILQELYSKHAEPGYARGVLAAIFLVNGFYCIGWTPLWSYPSEILTYETRSRGVTVQTGLLHITGFFATFVNPIGLENAGWKYYVAYVVYTFIELVVVWYFFVETRGYTLEEVTVIFDKPDLTWKQRRNMRVTSNDIHDQIRTIRHVPKGDNVEERDTAVEAPYKG